MRNRLALVAAAALVAGVKIAPVAAATGLAYDSVSKFSPGGEASSFAPGSFQSDFQTAAQPAPAQSHGGLFGGLANAVGGMSSMMRTLQTGTAERHYVAGSKERTDSLATQAATIVDCAARTLTTLDLAKKTYRITSLDATPEPAMHGNHAPGPAPTDDGSKVALTLTNKSLGAKTIESLPTTGYNSNVEMTITKPGQAPQSLDMDMTAYYSAYAQPAPLCPRPSAAAMLGGGPSMLASYRFLQRALHAPNGDPRFTVNASGPPLPSGKLSLFDVVTMKGQSQAHGGMVIVSERGNLRPVSDGDPVFSVPADFTKLP